MALDLTESCYILVAQAASGSSTCAPRPRRRARAPGLHAAARRRRARAAGQRRARAPARVLQRGRPGSAALLRSRAAGAAGGRGGRRRAARPARAGQRCARSAARPARAGQRVARLRAELDQGDVGRPARACVGLAADKSSLLERNTAVPERPTPTAPTLMLCTGRRTRSTQWARAFCVGAPCGRVCPSRRSPPACLCTALASAWWALAFFSKAVFLNRRAHLSAASTAATPPCAGRPRHPPRARRAAERAPRWRARFRRAAEWAPRWPARDGRAPRRRPPWRPAEAAAPADRPCRASRPPPPL